MRWGNAGCAHRTRAQEYLQFGFAEVGVLFSEDADVLDNLRRRGLLPKSLWFAGAGCERGGVAAVLVEDVPPAIQRSGADRECFTGGCYETPAGTIMLKAHRAMESLTLDREVAHLKDELMPRYAKLIYNGYWFSLERRMLQQMIDSSQISVNGEVKIRLYKGNVEVLGRRSGGDSLFDDKIVTFEQNAGAYDQTDATGFIRLNALRLRLAARKGKAE